MGNLQSYPSSSNTTYDVFLSFRGKDTRNCFTSHLYEALRRKGIETFIDNQIERGDELSSALMRAINESKISVVIFSEDYATAKWCLRELVEILKCKKMNNQIVLPVFYWVDPSDVRHQTKSFEAPFVEHEKNLQKEVQTWRDALAEACGIIGWHSSNGRTDAKLVKKIVTDIWEKLMSGYIPPDFEGLIGIKPRIEQIMASLCLHVTTDVRIIGIWGMGGIGKTTLADAIFNQNSNQFEGVCFIKNVREKLETCGGLDSVKEEILSKVLKDRDLKLDSLTIPPKIKERLNRLKVFLVLDDVDDFLKMETLVKGVDGLCQGSRIIITSRDKQVLRNCHVNDDNIYEVKGFNRRDALELFCKYAFHKNRHIEDSMVNKLVNFVNGNPLALKVLGSALYKKSKQDWESVVNKFEPTNLSSEIFDMLKISYDGLTNIQKGIFLDIACFLKGGKRDYVEKILDDCHHSLSVLIDKSLITISSSGKIEMHDLLEEMGRDIVNKESTNKIGTRSRMWKKEDVLCTLKNKYGAPEVQGILLDMFEINKDIHLSRQFFKKMDNLRLLKFYNSTYETHSKVNFLEGLNDLSDELRSLIWFGFPLQELPSNFNPNNLIELDLRGSNLERLREDCMEAPKLRWLNLSGCTRVTDIQVLSKFPLLESIDLKGCSSLKSFPSDIRFESLTSLDLSNCNNLTKFGSQISGNNITRLDLSGTAITELHHSISHLNGLEELFLRRCKKLKTLPSSICNLTSLRHLDLSDCSSLKISPENLDNLKSLKYLSADRIAIIELPTVMEKLTAMKKLSSGITHLSGLGLWYSLRRLFLSDCKLNSVPTDIGSFFKLVELDLSVNNFDGLPQSMMYLWNLEFLHLDNCKQLRSIPQALFFSRILTNSSPEYALSCLGVRDFKRITAEFIFTNCMNLEETAVGNMLAQLMKILHKEHANFNFCYPGREVPKGFRYTTEGSSITFRETFGRNLKGFAVCAVIAFEEYLFNGDSQHKLGVHFDCTCSDGDQSSPTNIMSETAYVASRNRTLINSDHVAFGYRKVSSPWRFRWFRAYSFEFRLSEESPNCRLKSCGVCPIYYQDSCAPYTGTRFDEEMDPLPQ